MAFLWPILAAVVANMILGFLWYAPFTFGPLWQKLVGLKPEQVKKGMVPALVTSIVSSAVTSFVILVLLISIGIGDFLNATILALLVWVGFMALPSLMQYMFEQRSKKLWTITTLYSLVSVLLMSWVLLFFIR